MRSVQKPLNVSLSWSSSRATSQHIYSLALCITLDVTQKPRVPTAIVSWHESSPHEDPKTRATLVRITPAQ